jgi:hypothetical protein
MIQSTGSGKSEQQAQWTGNQDGPGTTAQSTMESEMSPFSGRWRFAVKPHSGI